MTYVVAATWVAREGEEEHIAQILRTVAELTRHEPGCLLFVTHRSLEDPRRFLLYEQFEDEAAFRAHNESEHFKKHVLGDAVPRLEKRERTFFEILA
jgi:autoinducer 2-degrading protein